ncbi:MULTISPECIES: pilus assembly protein [Acinetobacter]|uniref:Competence factor involved in DNA binding and uptake n=2 Tax=Acinetobacter baylyi (strain ATCC 33305 / BD413 / ADP1) TaxID=62977 RepID=Q6F7H6_ACIAD|nr:MULTISPECIES: PilC/PilY family type IV pilus protein [Acinetobacter]ENV55036.1 hypothetical protein F952_00758 [Acinetobacter baylyi DSM 14961 = CIP 107474]KAF2371181.1 hypothetical protein BSL88_08070 [Acinetobacter baylyi]KAF2374610.1 hypothetical protein BSL67_04715 [Acinetobacter baylyi]KAF2377018.1 hypothetical protein BSN81_10255 [Acinetobacter baylyi]KAF2381743.1 hypothetical protein BSN83_04555 [Acinetobacter baylyi]
MKKSIYTQYLNSLYLVLQHKFSIFSISVFSCMLIMTSVVQASDVEVYQQGAQFDKRLMLMVDQSRSMGGAGALDLLKEYPICVGKGVSNVLGSGGGLGILGDKDALELVTDTVGAVDQVVLQGLLGGSLDPLLKITTESPSSKYNYARNYCTVVTTDLVVKTLDGLLKPLLGATGLDAKSYIENTCDFQANIQLLNSVSVVGVYRCYDKLSRVKNALTDVLLGNDKTGLKPLPDNVSVGLSAMPVDIMTKDRAGRILAPACKLSTTKASDTSNQCFEKGYAGSATTYRGYLVEKVANGIQSKGEFNLQNILLIVPKLVAALVGDVFNKLIGILTNPIRGLTDLLEFENTANVINDLLKTLGLSGNIPTASTYAETGAYLLGTSTKGTGARQIAMRIIPVKILFIPLLGWYDYKCDKYGKDSWQADGVTCKDDAWQYKLGGISTTNLIQVNDDLVSSLISDGVVGGLLNGVVGNILGIKVSEKHLYYGYDSQADIEYSGFNYRDNSVPTRNNNQFYQAPANQPQCNASGIMVITGGVPNITPTTTDVLLQPSGKEGLGTKNAIERLMGRSLDTQATDLSRLDLQSVFQCDESAGLKSTTLSSRDYATWSCIGNYSKKLLDKNVSTGVIGVGREFITIPSTKDSAQLEASMSNLNNSLLGQTVPNLVKDTLNVLLGGPLVNGLTNLLGNLFPTDAEDVKNLARWGVLGKGGWYNSASSENIANSVYSFYSDLGVTKRETFLGAPVIPTDPLTPYNLNNYVFQNMFVPDDKQTWFGNVKKYMTDTGETIQTKTFQDVWSNQNIDQTNILSGGVIDKLPIASGNNASTRQLYINRTCDTKAKKYDVSNAISAVGNNYYTQLCAGQTTDPRRNDLMNLLGYQIQSVNNQETLVAKPEYRKIGMVLHSTPIKITQSATVKDDGSLTRDDYLVFGSAEGLLHVVNADTGVEKLAFLPNEMLENSKQRKAFTGNGLEGHDSFSNMQYGVDGPWTAYTEYVWNSKDNKLTVGKSTTDAVCIKDGVFTGACGKQYLYGGLRMGGRSYYALDLNDLAAPKLKFYIDPASGRVYSDAYPGGKSFDAIKNMGQSWSKPTIAWINWQGKRKLVMFVGGGYDAGGTDGNSNNGGYELANYNQTNKRGAGVYMFDAENGDLLWWANNLATTSNDVSNSALNTNMQFSVVGRINTVDRDGDGLIDHLYFGDLGGQLWRVDINNRVDAKQFASAALLLDLQSNRPTDLKDTNVRFYEAPVFSIYGYGSESLAVLSIASSNRSLPISDKSAGAIFNIFDKDVTQVSFTTRDTYTDNKNLVAYSQLPKWGALTNENKPQYGWYVKLIDQQKVMDETAVINKSLYVSIYDPIAQDGRVADCSIGIQGLSSIRRYCLPYGVCEKQTDLSGMLKLGKGILPVTIGSGSTDNKSTRQLIGGFSKDERTNAANVLGQNTLRRQIVPLKWYEQSTP